MISNILSYSIQERQERQVQEDQRRKQLEAETARLEREAEEREKNRREEERRSIQMKAAKERMEEIKKTPLGAKVFAQLGEEVGYIYDLQQPIYLDSAITQVGTEGAWHRALLNLLHPYI